MGEKFKESCIYCGGDIYYESGRKLVVCQWCGNTMQITEFERELARLLQTREENEKIREELNNAELEKQAANDRLFSALSSLTQIQDEQDVLGKTLQLLGRGQEDGFAQVVLLKEMSQKLLSSQNDIFSRMEVMQEIGAHLQKIDMDAQARQSAMNDFMSWSQQMQEKDMLRLEELKESADSLLAGEREISSKIDALQKDADRHQQTLDSFHGEYSQDKLQELQELYRQAENFQQDRDYDKAAAFYRQVVTRGGGDAEVWWRLLLCHYCITYRRTDEGVMVPTILYPDLTAPDEMSVRREFEKAMEGSSNREAYEEELRKIDAILDEYRLAQQEAAYDIDVFISVKQEKDGHFTKDSDVASDLYDFLTSNGLKAFNSRRSVLPPGKSYEPYIISALLSAKAMIVVGSSAENMNAQWVKDEWSRFRWLQKREEAKYGKTDRRLLCYLAGGMRPEQIPRGLGTGRQAVVDGVKAHEQLSALLEVFPKRKAAAEDSFERVIGQMTAWLYTDKFDKVTDRYHELTEAGKYLEHAQLHLCALCAEHKVEEVQRLAESEIDLSGQPLFRLALKLSTGQQQQNLQKVLDQNQKYLRQKQKQKPKEPGVPKKTEAAKEPEVTKEPETPKKGPEVTKEPEAPKKPGAAKEPEAPKKEPGVTKEPKAPPVTGGGDDKPKKPFWMIGVAVIAVILLCFGASRLFGGSQSSTPQPFGGSQGSQSTGGNTSSAETEAVSGEETVTEAVSGEETVQAAAASESPKASSDQTYTLANPGKLTVGVSPDYPPLEYIDEKSGAITGFDVELAEALASVLGLDLELVEMSYDALLTGVASGDTDIAISGIVPTEERKKQCLFSDPYLIEGPMLLFVGLSPTDLEGIKAGYVNGKIPEDWVDQLTAVSWEAYSDMDSAVEALFQGRVDGLCISDLGYSEVKESMDKFGIDLNPDIQAEIPGFKDLAAECGVAVSKSNQGLQTAVNEALGLIYKDGTLTFLAESWFGTDYAVNGAVLEYYGFGF